LLQAFGGHRITPQLLEWQHPWKRQAGSEREGAMELGHGSRLSDKNVVHRNRSINYKENGLSISFKDVCLIKIELLVSMVFVPHGGIHCQG
jgi:hypothetical protein